MADQGFKPRVSGFRAQALASWDVPSLRCWSDDHIPSSQQNLCCFPFLWQQASDKLFSSLQNAVIKVVPTSNLIGLSRGLNEFTQRTANGVWLNAQVITDQGVTQGNTRTYIICVMTVEAGLHTEGTEGKKKSFPAVPICGYEGRSANRILWGPAHWGWRTGAEGIYRWRKIKLCSAGQCIVCLAKCGQIRPVCS